jgi:drug/metabolite transporter (DMT)-like permease
MGILLGLASALSWGSADLMARFATRRIGTLRTMLYMQLTGLVLMTLALCWLGGWGHLADGSGWRPWMWGILVGVMNALSTLALYRSFEIGKLSIVAPISSGYPALTTVLSVLSGERLTLARIAGIVLIIIGVMIVARGDSSGDTGDTTASGEPAVAGKHSGVGWALLSGVGFGILFWVLGIRTVPLVGSMPTVWLIRLTSVVVTATVMLGWRKSVALPGNATGWILGTGVLDTGAFVLANFGMRFEQVSVVSVLTSLYGAVTVGLAATILREKISRWQWIGIVMIFGGIVAISR